MILYLLRHGQTESNVAKLVTGSKQSKLTHEGTQQAIAAGSCLAESFPPFDRYYCSPWFRARETARLALPDANFLVDDRLGETWAGDAAEMPRDVFEQNNPNFFKKFDPAVHFPNGESHDDLNRRVVDWLFDIAVSAKENELVFAVTHMGPISCIFQYLSCVPMVLFPKFKPGNCTLSSAFVSQDASPAISKALFCGLDLKLNAAH